MIIFIFFSQDFVAYFSYFDSGLTSVTGAFS